MTPHEELRALLDNLPNPERAMELLEQVVAAPESGDVDEDMLEAGMAHVAQRLAKAEAELTQIRAQVAAVPVVGEPVAWRCKDSCDGWILEQHKAAASAYQSHTGCLMQGLVPVPTASIPRARLDELLEAEAEFKSLRIDYAMQKASLQVRSEHLASAEIAIQERDEKLMAAEKRVEKLYEALEVAFQHVSQDTHINDFNTVKAALSASKADGKGGA